jgi:hypothetical protein
MVMGNPNGWYFEKRPRFEKGHCCPRVTLQFVVLLAAERFLFYQDFLWNGKFPNVMKISGKPEVFQFLIRKANGLAELKGIRSGTCSVPNHFGFSSFYTIYERGQGFFIGKAFRERTRKMFCLDK